MTDNETAQKDEYYTIQATLRSELKIKGSRFIATAIPIATRDQAKEEIDLVRREFYDATHNCYAYRLGIHGLEFRAVDDGEPSGTAGKPILFSIQKYALSDILVVVTRFFGGTKLGKNNLGPAYSSAAGEVLSRAERKIMYRTEDVKVFCTYEDLKLVLPVIESTAVHVSSDYRDAIVFDTKIKVSQVEEFIATIQRVTNARAGCLVGAADE